MSIKTFCLLVAFSRMSIIIFDGLDSNHDTDNITRRRCFQTNNVQPNQLQKLFIEHFFRQVPFWTFNIALERDTMVVQSVRLARTIVLDTKAMRCHRLWISVMVDLEQGFESIERVSERGDTKRRNSFCAIGCKCAFWNTWYVVCACSLVPCSHLRFMCCQRQTLLMFDDGYDKEMNRFS